MFRICLQHSQQLKHLIIKVIVNINNISFDPEWKRLLCATIVEYGVQ
jgi:hypothetical protein